MRAHIAVALACWIMTLARVARVTIALLFVFSSSAFAAPLTFDNASQAAGASGGSTSVTVSHATGSLSSGCLIVGCGIDSSTVTLSGITYNSVALTLIDRRQGGGGGENSTELWYLLNPASGTHNVVATLTASNGAACIAMTFSDCLQLAPPIRGSAVLAGGASTTPSASVTSVVGDIVIGCATQGTPSTMTHNQGTERGDIASAGGSSMQVACTTLPGTGGSDTISWTITSGGWSEVAISLQPSLDSVGGQVFQW